MPLDVLGRCTDRASDFIALAGMSGNLVKLCPAGDRAFQLLLFSECCSAFSTGLGITYLQPCLSSHVVAQTVSTNDNLQNSAASPTTRCGLESMPYRNILTDQTLHRFLPAPFRPSLSPRCRFAHASVFSSNGFPRDIRSAKLSPITVNTAFHMPIKAHSMN